MTKSVRLGMHVATPFIPPYQGDRRVRRKTAPTGEVRKF